MRSSEDVSMADDVAVEIDIDSERVSDTSSQPVAFGVAERLSLRKEKEWSRPSQGGRGTAEREEWKQQKREPIPVGPRCNPKIITCSTHGR